MTPKHGNDVLEEKWYSDLGNFRSFIDEDHWPPNNPNLNSLDYCIWNELVEAIQWSKVTSKTTLMVELKHAIEKILQDVVLESCSAWTNRLYRMSQNDGDYLR